MKVLYIGYYKEPSEWGRVTRNNILALDSADVDVVCRSISLTGNMTPEDIYKLEQKDESDCDVCIQHVFPEHLLGSDKFKKNIAIMSNEFLEMEHSDWVERLDMMDEIWLPSEFALSCVPKQIAHKCKFVPVCFDTEVYKTAHPLINVPDVDDKFKFYTCVDNASGLEHLVKAFHTEFTTEEEAFLLIQVNGEQDNVGVIDKTVNEIKMGLGIHSDAAQYKRDVIVPHEQKDGPSYRMHQYGDCYVSCNSGRTMSCDVFDAEAFGSQPIVPRNTDAQSYIGEDQLISCVFNIRSDAGKNAWSSTYNGRSYNLVPCQKELKAKMRTAFEEWKKNPMCGIGRKRKGLETAERFSIQNVGPFMKGVLNA